MAKLNNLILFGGSHCNPCKMQKKILDAGNVKYDYVDVNNDPEGVSISYNIGSIPTLIFTGDNGAIANSRVGMVDLTTVKRLISG